jgi:peptidoglycan/LPS O-acetylase OafA/YrhL
MPGRFQSLDGLRGVCALTVVLYHCELLFAPGVIFCHGYLAVDLFFILSGFVIAANYDHRFLAGLSAKQFLSARLRRLAPVYWTALALTLLAALVVEHYRPAPDFAGALRLGVMAAFLLPHVGQGAFAYPTNSVAWSLAWEIIVNGLYALGLYRLRARSLIAITSLLWLLALMESLVNPRGWSFGMTGMDIWMGGLRALPGFLAGVLLFRAHQSGLLARLPALSSLVLVLIWPLVAVIPQSGPTPWLDAGLTLFASLPLVALMARNATLVPAWFAPLGGISYALYASHLALINLARGTPLFGFDRQPNPLMAICIVLLALVVAGIIHRFAEPGTKPPTALFSPALPQRR